MQKLALKILRDYQNPADPARIDFALSAREIRQLLGDRDIRRGVNAAREVPAALGAIAIDNGDGDTDELTDEMTVLAGKLALLLGPAVRHLIAAGLLSPCARCQRATKTQSTRARHPTPGGIVNGPHQPHCKKDSR